MDCVYSTCIYKISSNRSENFNRAVVLSLQIEECQKINYWFQPEELVSSSWIQTLCLRNLFIPKEDQRTVCLLMLILIQANALQNQISCPRIGDFSILIPCQSDLGKCKFLIFKASFQCHLLIILVPHPQRAKKKQKTFF